MERNSLFHFSDKVNNFQKSIEILPFFLLVRPDKSIYRDNSFKQKFKDNLQEIIDKGLVNLELPWENNNDWLDLMSDLRSSFPNINLGSATILSKKSIDDSVNLGLDFSMMRFWKKDLYQYAKKKIIY